MRSFCRLWAFRRLLSQRLTLHNTYTKYLGKSLSTFKWHSLMKYIFVSAFFMTSFTFHIRSMCYTYVVLHILCELHFTSDFPSIVLVSFRNSVFDFFCSWCSWIVRAISFICKGIYSLKRNKKFIVSDQNQWVNNFRNVKTKCY